MYRPTISIICPVYKSEKYIHKCVDSIIAQTFKDWELIIVDDGSPDSSGDICDKYALIDTRIKILHKQNGGVSTARQRGLEAVRGEYVIHADSDDWIEPSMLEVLYRTAKEEKADVVVCDYYVNDHNGQRLIKQQPTQLTSMAMLHDLFHGLHGSLWNKLVRRDCYINYGLKFYDGINYCEDVLIWAQLLQYNDVKVTYIPQAFYHYCDNELSITRSYTRETYAIRLKYQKKLEEILTSADFKEDVKESAFNIYIEAFIYDVLTKDEIRAGLQQYKHQIVALKSIKWRLGFVFLSLGFSRLAHLCIHY